MLLSGGETTVTCAATAAAAATANSCWRWPALSDGAPGIAALACDTDGIDGTEDNAGAIVYPDTLARAARERRAIRKRWRENDGYGFFAAIGRSRRHRPDPDQCQ